MSPISQKGDAVCLAVRVQPRSSKSGVAGMHGEQIKICLKSAPVDNAANKECCELLAKALGVPRSSVSVMNGASSRSKVLKAEGLTPSAVREALSSVLGDEAEAGA
ncbi:hypothetical protein BIU88_09910 [Chlorobaculum limnaeum]|uniref:UPF0235 protein BIU88_09910 n=1 Tax=Chlorobaculum limnaeum TaxID=274537 RepID=A0A1D8CZQ3_CHLLM|nr:DUF167 domain-containing protein [Chlorobaculum limnaeum]AOS84416.1 hypothetical protein BIU88_09910 [Chlorobaculum limnaeum]